jgi:hypothetical protein
MQMVVHYLSLFAGGCDGLLHQGFKVSVDFACYLLLTFLVVFNQGKEWGGVHLLDSTVRAFCGM